MDEETRALQAQIAALTAAVEKLAGRPSQPDIRIAALAERYARTVGVKMMYTLAPFLRHFGDRFVLELRPADYIRWRDEVRAKQHILKRRPPLPPKFPSVGTLNQELRQALAMFRWGLRLEHTTTNPIQGVRFLKGQRPRETEIDPDEDARAFSDAPLLVRAFQAVCNETGARNGCEVRTLERSHINRVAKSIRFWRVNTKGKVMTRDVPVSDELLALLEELPPVVGSPFVFANPRTKKPYSRVHLCVLSRPYLNRLTPAPGDERVVTHDRRHTRVSRLARAGMNPMTSMKIVGHKTAAQHWKYLHVSAEDRDRMREVLAAERQGPVPSHRGNYTRLRTTPKV